MANIDEASLRELMMNFQNQQLASGSSSEEESIYQNPEAMLRALGAGLPGGLPMPKLTTAADVRNKAKSYVSDIFDCLSFISKVLDRHEETIYKRWLKKTRNQRCRLLMSAWPNMVVTHRPDFAALRAESEGQRMAGTRYRDSFLMPYINMDDLSRPRILPLLLHARGHTQPGEFAFSDLEACHIGIISKAIVPEFLNEYVMLFSGRDSASTYGELVSWEDEPEAFSWMHERIAPQPGEGLLTLEIQSRLYTFLKECCKLIMHDIPEDRLISHDYPVQSKFHPPSENDTETFQSLAILAMEAPYRRPALLDWDRIKTLLLAKKTSAEDHIWSLREDPGYFADSVLEYKEHRQELLKDSKGQEHPLFKYQQTDVFWGRVLDNVVTNAYISLEIWNELADQADRLIELEQKHRTDIKQTSALPEEYLSAILKFEHYLKQSAKGAFSTLKHTVVASPAFRPFFERVPPPDTQTPRIIIESKTGLRADKTVEQLRYLLQTLWEDSQNLFLLRLTNVVDELQRLIQAESKASDAISAYLAEVIGDLSITCECLRQVQTYYPWSANFENALVDREESIQKQFAQQTAPWGSLMACLKLIEKRPQLGTPEDGKFRYPIDKRRSKDNVSQLRAAERNLDLFWAEVDRATAKAQGFSDLATGNLFKQSKVLKRTPEWIEPTKETDDVQLPAADTDLPLSAMYFDIGKSQFDAPKFKEKKKTRGNPGKSKETQSTPVEQKITDKQPTFALDHRAMKVFRTVFYTPSTTATPGEVPWTDFVHAMISTGFSAEKLYGSVWQFRPTKPDVDRGIQFHEPHPASKLPYRTARRFGRRLNRAYGWHGEMFIQKTLRNQRCTFCELVSHQPQMRAVNGQKSEANPSEVQQDESRVEVFGEVRSTEESERIIILCFHGSGVDAGPDWRALVDQLAKDYLVVVFHRGPGNSKPADHVKYVSDYLSRNGFNGSLILVAHSYGGLFAKHFLYLHRKKVAGMVLVETGKGGQQSSEEVRMLRRTWMGTVPLSVIRGNSLLAQFQRLERTSAIVSNDQERNEIESKRKWLLTCDEEDEKLEMEQLKLSSNCHYVHLQHCGHNVIRDSPDTVVAEVRWVLENRRSKGSSWFGGQWLSNLIDLLR